MQFQEVKDNVKDDLSSSQSNDRIEGPLSKPLVRAGVVFAVYRDVAR